MKKENELWIPFDPSPVDVVSTKVRTWNHNHPGNAYYCDLVNRHVASLTTRDIETVRKTAKTIVHHILDERGGRFLKPRDGDVNPEMCVHMDRKQALGKVVHALRTAHSRTEKRNSPGGGGTTTPTPTPTVPKKKKKKVSMVGASSSKAPQQPSSGGAPRLGTRRSSSLTGELLAYKAKAGTGNGTGTGTGTQKIAKPILKCISAVCSQREAKTAHRVLDRPLGGQTRESEPTLERLTRLQLRHRFASAAAMGMSPLEFATKLLTLWDGKLVLTKRETKLKSPPPASSMCSTPGSSATTPEEKPFPFPALQQIPQTATSLPENFGEVVQNPMVPVITGEQSIATNNSVPISPVLGAENRPMSAELSATISTSFAAPLESIGAVRMPTIPPSADKPIVTPSIIDQSTTTTTTTTKPVAEPLSITTPIAEPLPTTTTLTTDQPAIADPATMDSFSTAPLLS